LTAMPPPQIYTLSLHDALPISHPHAPDRRTCVGRVALTRSTVHIPDVLADPEYTWVGSEISGLRTLLGVPVLLDEELIGVIGIRSEEHTSELQSRFDLVCRLLL